MIRRDRRRRFTSEEGDGTATPPPVVGVVVIDPGGVTWRVREIHADHSDMVLLEDVDDPTHKRTAAWHEVAL